MSIGFTVFIEFSHDEFASIANNRCATPGSVFFWHQRLEMEIFGLPISERVKTDHPFGLRGVPNCLSRPIVRRHHLIVTEKAPNNLAEKKRTRRFSYEDLGVWESQELQIWPIPNDPLYEIELEESDEFILDPGCQRPSWLTSRELKLVLSALGIDLQSGNADSDLYNASVFQWVFRLADIYGDDGVRIVYWFDCLPSEYLRVGVKSLQELNRRPKNHGITQNNKSVHPSGD
jgi:hypothetical protein